MSIQSVIVCDGCGARGETFVWPKKAHEARADLRRTDWATQQLRGLDYCPDCARAAYCPRRASLIIL